MRPAWTSRTPLFLLLRILALVGGVFSASSPLSGRDGDPSVFYQPATANVEGDQPFTHSYVLSITAPAGITYPQTVVPTVAVLSAPGGVSTATALSFVTLSTSIDAPLVFTAAGQVRTATVTVEVPEGASTGDYAWAISTPGWSQPVFDGYAFINARVNVSRSVASPAITIAQPLDGSVYTIGAGTLEIPLKFAATAPIVAPITGIDADISGTAVDDLTADGLGSDTVLADGTLRIAHPGIYTIQARATNAGGTSANTVEVTVNRGAAAPAVTIAAPAPDSQYSLLSGNSLSIPFSFTGTSAEGVVTAISATLNGVPVAVEKSGIGTLTATGTGVLDVDVSGTHVLAVTATNEIGSATATRSITIVEVVPAGPTVAISSPAHGSTLELPADGTPLTVSFAFTAEAAGQQTISSASAALNGDPLTVVSTGINTPSSISNGSVVITAPGDYTLSATAVSAGFSGVASVSFTVRTASPPRRECSLEWLPPISLGKVQKGGSIVPIKFGLDCGCASCQRDTTVVIAVHEVFANGSSSEAVLYPHGAGSPNPGNYSLNANGMYHLNFPTSKGSHRYHIDVIRPARETGAPEILGTKQFTTN
jgi:hypothetical protein